MWIASGREVPWNTGEAGNEDGEDFGEVDEGCPTVRLLRHFREDPVRVREEVLEEIHQEAGDLSAR